MADNNNYIINIITNFLYEFPILYSPKSKNDKTNPKTDDGKKLIKSRITNSLCKTIIPSFPKTIPDPLVSVILENYYDFEKEHIHKVEKEHQFSMAAENKVGEYLELYISSISHPRKSWVNCTDGIVRGIDFIKKEKNCWKLLQVKNKSNTENSSSQKIRDSIKKEYNLDISIDKWHRMNALTGKTMWANFPDNTLNKILNENAFKKFIIEYILGIKKQDSVIEEFKF